MTSSSDLYGDLDDPIVIAVAVAGLALHGDPHWINADFPYPNTAWYCAEQIPAVRLRRCN